MLEKIVVWSLIKSGHKKIGNFFQMDGILVHKKKIIFDLIGKTFLILAIIIYLIFIYIIAKFIL